MIDNIVSMKMYTTWTPIQVFGFRSTTNEISDSYKFRVGCPNDTLFDVLKSSWHRKYVNILATKVIRKVFNTYYVDYRYTYLP